MMSGKDSPDTVTVDATLEMDGRLTVRSLVWQGHDVVITATGRQWVEESSGCLRRCVLVMSNENTTFELYLDGADALWHVRKTWSPGYTV